MGSHHVRKIRLPLTYNRSFDLCIESLKFFKRCKIREENRNEGRIVAKAGINWKTWSDTISFDIRNADNGYIDVTVSSRPTARTTLFDFGKNLDNVEKIIGFLEKHRGIGK